MNAVKLVGVVLIAAGLAGLLYGGFSFTRETHEIKLGPIELSVKEKQAVNIPRRAVADWRQKRLASGSGNCLSQSVWKNQGKRRRPLSDYRVFHGGIPDG